MLEPWRTGKVIKIENANSSTRRFWIEIPDAASFDFKPGQFVTLDLPIHEKKTKDGAATPSLLHRTAPILLNW